MSAFLKGLAGMALAAAVLYGMQRTTPPSPLRKALTGCFRRQA